jgi:hypothetical protein
MPACQFDHLKFADWNFTVRYQHFLHRYTVSVVAFILSSGLFTAAQQASSTEMQRVFEEDQKDRDMNMARITPQQRAKWGTEVEARDKARRKQVLEFLSKGQLHTGDDYQEAAFVFQHGSTPNDFLLAHTFAMVSVAKGNAKSRWIAAASLDRYLQRMKQPQIFGTQYTVGGSVGDKWTQAPYNRTLLPDTLRKLMCVPLQSEQAEVVTGLNAGKEPSRSGQKDEGCN